MKPRLPFLICLLACLCLGPTRALTSDSAQVLTLEGAIQRALAKSYAVKIDSLAVPLARTELTEAFEALDPRFEGSFQQGRSVSPELSLLGFPRPDASISESSFSNLSLKGILPWGLAFDLGLKVDQAEPKALGLPRSVSSFAGLTLSQPLLKGFGTGPTLHTIRVARNRLAVSEWEFRGALTDLITQVVSAYSDLQFAQARFRSAKRAFDSTEQLQKDNLRRFSVGSMSEYDVLTAQARVADRRNGLLAADAGQKIAENQLRQLLSDERSSQLLSEEWVLAPAFLPELPVIDEAGDTHFALAHRPDFQRATLALQRGELDRAFYRNQLLPRLDLIVSSGFKGLADRWQGSHADLKSRDFYTNSAGLSISVPLFAAGERGRFRNAKFRLQQARLLLEKLEQDIVLAIANTAIQLRASHERVAVTRQARQLSEQALEADLKRLRAGTGSTFDVLYQQEQLAYAEISEAAAFTDYQKALAEYLRQTGRTLQAHQVSLAN